MRKPIIAGNWKMNKTVSEAVELCRNLEQILGDTNVEVVVCPPFTALSPLCALGMERIKLGAQNMSNKESGAYTGETSVLMLQDVCCDYVIIGHSERRQLFNETDQIINEKVHLALKHGIKPIICVGETLKQRQEGETEKVVVDQIKAGFHEIGANKAIDIVVAYEPIWAIGTGETASAQQANAVIGTIRKTLASIYDSNTANKIRIQYGGSVKPENIQELMEQPEIDGALVGGASLDAGDFCALVNYDKTQ